MHAVVGNVMSVTKTDVDDFVYSHFHRFCRQNLNSHDVIIYESYVH